MHLISGYVMLTVNIKEIKSYVTNYCNLESGRLDYLHVKYKIVKSFECFEEEL